MWVSNMTRTYLEVIELKTFHERYEYLKISGRVGDFTFANKRYLNQIFYQSKEWRDIKRKIIIRDNGCDLAHPDYEINGKAIYIHHINPITIDDILNKRPCVFDPNNLISTSFQTHNAIHYGNSNYGKQQEFVERKLYDTCPWRL